MKARSAQGVLTLLNFLPVPAHGVIVSTHVRKYVICTNWNVYMAPFNVLYCKVVIDFVMVKLVLTFDLYVYDVFICTSVFIVCPCSHCIISHQKPLTTAISLKGKDSITTVHCTMYLELHCIHIYTTGMKHFVQDLWSASESANLQDRRRYIPRVHKNGRLE